MLKTAEWQAKTISGFIVGTCWAEEQDKKDLMRTIQGLSITGRELTPEEKATAAARGPVVAEDYRDDPRLQKPPDPSKSEMVKVGPADDDVLPRWVVDPEIPDNQMGTFEALRGGWGSERRRAFEVPGGGA